MRPLEMPNDAGIFHDLAHFFVPGPRYAPEGAGKGALATTFALTTLVDDKAECLRSFYYEGVLRTNPSAGKMLQALWGLNVRPSWVKTHIPCHTWGDVLTQLEELTCGSTDKNLLEHTDSTDISTTCNESEVDTFDRRNSFDALSSHSDGNCNSYGEALTHSDGDADEEDERLYRCTECGDAAELGALDEQDDAWYCKDCWLSYAAVEESASDAAIPDTQAIPAERIARPSGEQNPDHLVCEESEQSERLYSCAECGDAAPLGAFDEEENCWFCKACWLAFAAAETGNSDYEATHALGDSGIDIVQHDEDDERLYRCNECRQSPPFGAVDEEDGQWYCKGCWGALLEGQ